MGEGMYWAVVSVWMKEWIKGHIVDFVRLCINKLCQLLNMDRLLC